MRVTDSAFKHGITEADIHAFTNAVRSVEVEQHGDRLIVIGPDRAGNWLELVAMPADGADRIIHADRPRPEVLWASPIKRRRSASDADGHLDCPSGSRGWQPNTAPHAASANGSDGLARRSEHLDEAGGAGRAGESSVAGEQRRAQGFGQCETGGIVCGQVVPQLPTAGQQRKVWGPVHR